MFFCGYFLKKKHQWLTQREDALIEGNLHLARERARLAEDKAEHRLAKKKLARQKKELEEERKVLEQEISKFEANKTQFAYDAEVERDLMESARKAHNERMYEIGIAAKCEQN